MEQKRKLSKEEQQAICCSCQKCCKIITCKTTFRWHDTYAADFFKARGFDIRETPNGYIYFVVPHICAQLTEEGCKMYQDRPQACKDYIGTEDPAMGKECLLYGWEIDAD